MKHITDEDIENVAILSKLELCKAEKSKAKEHIELMLNYIDKMNELDTEGVAPLSHIFEVNNVFREDIIVNGDESKNILRNAPEVEKECFKVPKTVS